MGLDNRHLGNRRGVFDAFLLYPLTLQMQLQGTNAVVRDLGRYVEDIRATNGGRRESPWRSGHEAQRSIRAPVTLADVSSRSLYFLHLVCRCNSSAGLFVVEMIIVVNLPDSWPARF
jgi:hypothetical protein